MFLKFYILAGGSKSSSLGIVLGIVGAVIAVVGIGCGIFVCQQRKKTRPIKEWVKVFYQNPSSPVSPKGPEAANDNIEIFIRNYGNLAPKRYKYSEIEKMTNSFLEKLGHGGYGSVYKGQLPNGHLVAVKLLSEATGNGEDFINEVASIGRTSHVNIVTLLGFCFEGKKRALLYKFMPNGSLDKFLRGDGSHLDWNTLFQIAKGIARGLEYLHKGCNTRIVHFDIKPHNILLDEEFVPKISDFGLAKLCKTKESIVSVMGARGTAGYMAPEVFFKSLGGASHKSDVYSYGMMVLEMTGARKHNNTSVNSTSEAYFPDWVYKQVEVGGDLEDYGVTSEEEEELARKMMIVSLWCIQSNPSDRPSISKVVEMLEGSFELLQVPPRRFEPSPARPFQRTPTSSIQSSSFERISTVQGKISLPFSHEAS
ncbi:putative glycerophosphodiester phosphodiesterase, protein kinase RLK-Pelle-LRK10L-2 family [Helianthus annuus]|nr:putative glycerophosphodiester phosphodiesterase, protein kinase RLK-Pelle-LRK10L-2 family [Helianthus annuus]KAJ0515989.1 putative glycerophosphodiester phosphodiesterase, protein kinase RLK-Pelle-LRK10L-2 family [Helianthus annuus]KAJ0683998.1 putative glycerophosphodiester phosphodiesterase, protein kinase RLK-Pelle-LRK10L-2 family [Helianthus annuus]